MDQNSPVTEIKGVGKKTAEGFLRLDISTVGGLLAHYPRDYVKYPKIEELNRLDSLSEGMHALSVQVTRSPVVKNTARMPITILDVGDEGHKIRLVWFRAPYIRSTVIPGKHYIFYGKITIKNNRYGMEQPVVYDPEKYLSLAEQLQPVYDLTKGITNNQLTKAMRTALDQEGLLSDHLPAAVRRKNQLCEYNYALKQIHFPDSMETLIGARDRLVFDEFFSFILGLQYQKERTAKEENSFAFTDTAFVARLIKKLPYALTKAQQRTLDEILDNMTGPFVMQRLIQGDVGSGKTIIAFLAMAWTAASGYQSAIMAPTEVLARQHYDSFAELSDLLGLNSRIVLLTGSMTRRQKAQAYERLLLYPDAMVIGTHALIQEKVEFDHLALVITDEQHRFGVKQRDVFSGKGEHPHILVMSATPIPRTLAIILYGDLDISVIDEVPARRKPVKNCVVGPGYRPKAYEFIQKEITSGHQAYVICPLVEATENMDVENVTDYGVMLAEKLGPSVRVGILHGRQKPALKNEIMEQFAANELQVLVSTTVVEVGVNVPNATVMMIEDAQRFGLAQLHQLRGRVGRGDAQAYCIMINSSDGKNAQKRLEILNKSNDGFFIASEDLKLRGPGDFFGIRQSGEIAFALADIYQDAAVMKKAAAAVDEILQEDPDLEEEEHRILKCEMEHFMVNQLQRMNL